MSYKINPVTIDTDAMDRAVLSNALHVYSVELTKSINRRKPSELRDTACRELERVHDLIARFHAIDAE